MKNWKLFKWAVSHLKLKDGDYQYCLRNNILIFIMNLSGVKPSDVKLNQFRYGKSNNFIDIDLA